MSSFSFFGCWNQGFCTNNPFRYVSEHIKENDTDFVIVAGDNYYPTKKGKKGKKEKIFDEDSFHSGFKCLLDINKETYVLMGNHDLQYEKKLYSKIAEPLDKCHITKNQISNYKNDLIYDSQYYINGDSLILFLNTSLYTSDKNKMFDCFKQYRYPYAKSIDEIIEIERESLYEIANEFKYCKEIIIVGHHPMVSLRNKKIIEHLNEDGLNLFDELYSLFQDKNKYYLCADVHQYQKGTIQHGKHTIIQYVVGTGGTKLDDDKCHELTTKTFPKYNLSYTMEECDNKNFGYLLFDGSEFSFIKVKTNFNDDFYLSPYEKEIPIKLFKKLQTTNRNTTQRQSTKRGTTKRQSTKRGTTKRQSTKRGTTKRGTTKRQSTKRGTTKRWTTNY